MYHSVSFALRNRPLDAAQLVSRPTLTSLPAQDMEMVCRLCGAGRFATLV